MATPQDPNAAASLIDQIAAKQMGVQPAAPAAAPQQAPAQKPDSAEAKAATQGSPETESDKMQAPAVVYEVEFGPQDKRKLTPEQIASTFQRYSALNFKNQALAPVNSIIQRIMQENPGMTPADVAQKMEAIYRAQQPNAQFGGPSPSNQPQQPGQAGNPPQTNQSMDDVFKKWEEENAASLPPGYREMVSGTQGELQQMKAALAQTQQMLKMVLGQTQGVADAARMGVQQAQADTSNVIRQQISNNVDRAQAALQLPDEAANDFLTFATERGYTLEDFVDPQLTYRVMADFRNNMNSPEMERLKAIASRRQSYTGSLGAATPSSGAPGAGQQSSRFDQFAGNIMAQKGLG